MKSLKSLLGLSLAALVISGSAFATENPLASITDSAKSSVTQSVKDSAKKAVTEKLTSGSSNLSTLEKVASAKEKVDSVKEKVTSLTGSASSSKSLKETATDKLNSVKEKVTSAVKEKVSKSSKVNINTADVTTLQQLSGIGEKKAQAIVDYRKKVGTIKSAAELSNIDGLGSTTIEKITPFLNFSK